MPKLGFRVEGWLDTFSVESKILVEFEHTVESEVGGEGWIVGCGAEAGFQGRGLVR